MKKQYSVKEVSEMAGVSVRTLHLYDEIGLLKPSARTEAGYRMYDEAGLYRLQQVIFYRELGFSLSSIREVLDDPDFDLVAALQQHRAALKERLTGIETMLKTVDKTIINIKKKRKMKHEDLYKGLPREKAEAFRKEAVERYGKDSVGRSENYLRSLGSDGFEKLKSDHGTVTTSLFELRDRPADDKRVQELIERHYELTRMFWGTHGSADPQFDAYAGLGELYMADERFTMREGRSWPEFAAFMRDAMRIFAQAKKDI